MADDLAGGDVERGEQCRRAVAGFRDLERVAGAAFGQRRKMLRQSLKSLGVDAAELIAAAGVTPTARAEELSVEEFCALALALAAAS